MTALTDDKIDVRSPLLFQVVEGIVCQHQRGVTFPVSFYSVSDVRVQRGGELVVGATPNAKENAPVHVTKRLGARIVLWLASVTRRFLGHAFAVVWVRVHVGEVQETALELARTGDCRAHDLIRTALCGRGVGGRTVCDAQRDLRGCRERLVQRAEQPEPEQGLSKVVHG